MIIFKLPDLGEGLPDAIIREWHVKVGDTVKTDQPMVSMETAKALVEVPAPFAGKIEKLFGDSGDNIDTGQPLVGFEGEDSSTHAKKDTGTVVGKIQEGETVLAAEAVSVAQAAQSESSRIKATPAVRALAKKLGIDLATVNSSGLRITQEDVEKAAKAHKKQETGNGYEKLSPMQRAMVASMEESHRRVVPLCIWEDADLHAWNDQQDISIRIIRALIHACQTVPILNATFDDKNQQLKLNPEIHLGLAMDTPHGLYVPVIKNVASLNDRELREKIDTYKSQANQKSLAQQDLHGATIILSNFGSIGARYGTPIVIPPMVAIVGVGHARDAVVPYQGKPAIHRILPLSITVDHRIITGGEEMRFLKAMIEHLA